MQDDDIVIESGASDEGGSEEELEAMESSAAGKIAKMKAELEACRKEKQEYLDGWQRAKADYVNALKRFETEKVEAMQKGVSKGARAFIPVMDSLARAEGAGEIPEAFAAIAKQLHDAAKDLGLAQFGAVGDTFDPALHEALGTDEAKSAKDDDTVSVVLECGWKSGDVVIRPAKVRVAHLGE